MTVREAVCAIIAGAIRRHAPHLAEPEATAMADTVARDLWAAGWRLLPPVKPRSSDIDGDVARPAI
jgi:hypothetical protein